MSRALSFVLLFSLLLAPLFAARIAAADASPSGEGAPPRPRMLAVNGVMVNDGSIVDTALGRTLAVTFDAEPGSDATLILDDEPIKGLVVRRGVGEKPTLLFELERRPENDGLWRRLLAHRNGSYSMAIGFPDAARAVPGPRVVFDLFPSRAVAMSAFVLFAILLVGSGCVVSAGGLRDAGKGSSLSLGRVQMLAWTLLVTGAFLVLWAVTGATDTLTSQGVILIGISGSTALGAAVVDRTKNSASLTAVADARAAGTGVQKAIDGSPFKPQGALADLLGGDHGPTLHRMQMLVWTVVLGVVFIVDVIRDLAMPQFSDTLLGLMGVSAGTYVGFKFPESS